MAQAIPPPDTQTLIPPLLACLPTSFASSKPPPAFVPLLSPILKQRLEIHTSTSTSHDSWIRFLCWDSSKAERLKEIVENSNFEPHPSSGELEVGDVERVSYKRLDAETLKAQIPLTDWDLTAIYMWTTGTEEGNIWKLAELLPYDSDLSHDPSWSNSVTEAGEKAPTHAPVQHAKTGGLSVPGQHEDDDDDYWAQYDNTPGRTPGQATPARNPPANPRGQHSDADYYAQYKKVQPAMDNYDPDEHHEELGQSTLNGSILEDLNHDRANPPQQPPPDTFQNRQATPQRVMFPNPDVEQLDIPQDRDQSQLREPIPMSPGSRSSRAGSDLVARMEETADRYSASEVAIKQHIAYSVKSMYRLAKGAGMSRQEFEEMVQRELETLSILDRE